MSLILPTVTDVGVGGIFALLVLREVFAFLNRRKNGTGAIPLSRSDTGDLEKYVCRAQTIIPCGFLESRDELRDLLRDIEKNTRPNGG